MNKIEEYLDRLANYNLSQCLELGQMAAEALVLHCTEMGADQFELPIEINGKVYVVSVAVNDIKFN